VSPYIAIFYLRVAFTCLTFLVGVGGGVYLIARKQILPGALALGGFVLLSIDPLANVAVPRLFAGSSNFVGLSLTIACVSSIATLLGALILLAALFSVFVGRERMLPVGLALGGFGLFGLVPVINTISPRLFSISPRDATNWVVVLSCFGTLAMLLGVVALVAALATATRVHTDEQA
jgi:hypothetical protein